MPFIIIFLLALSACEYNVEKMNDMGVNEICDPTISYTNTIKTIIDNNCISCHNGTQSPDLRTYQGNSINGINIKNQVVSRAMPLGGTLTNDEINLISCWVDNGTPNN